MIRRRYCYDVLEYPDAIERTRVDEHGTTFEWYSPADKVSVSYGWMAKPYTLTAVTCEEELKARGPLLKPKDRK